MVNRFTILIGLLLLSIGCVQSFEEALQENVTRYRCADAGQPCLDGYHCTAGTCQRLNEPEPPEQRDSTIAPEPPEGGNADGNVGLGGEAGSGGDAGREGSAPMGGEGAMGAEPGTSGTAGQGGTAAMGGDSGAGGAAGQGGTAAMGGDSGAGGDGGIGGAAGEGGEAGAGNAGGESGASSMNDDANAIADCRSFCSDFESAMSTCGFRDCRAIADCERECGTTAMESDRFLDFLLAILSAAEVTDGDFEQAMGRVSRGGECGDLPPRLLVAISKVSAVEDLSCPTRDSSQVNEISICHDGFPSTRPTSVQWIEERAKTLTVFDDATQSNPISEASVFSLSNFEVLNGQYAEVSLEFSTRENAVQAAASLTLTQADGLSIVALPPVDYSLLQERSNQYGRLHGETFRFSNNATNVSEVVTRIAMHDGQGQALPGESAIFKLVVGIDNTNERSVELSANIDFKAKLSGVEQWPNCNDNCLTPNFCAQLCRIADSQSCVDDSRDHCLRPLADSNRFIDCIAECQNDRCRYRFDLTGMSYKKLVPVASPPTEMHQCSSAMLCIP